MTTKREAELELENLRLRSALENTKQYVGFMAIQQIDKLLSTTPSTEALAELVEKVEELTLEKAADIAWEMYSNGPEAVDQTIRSLPTGNIKLEDLL